MNSKDALENIGIEFDNMGLICTNLCYESFYFKDLFFSEIFKTEIDIIKRDLDRLEKLEKELRNFIDTLNKYLYVNDGKTLFIAIDCMNNDDLILIKKNLNIGDDKNE